MIATTDNRNLVMGNGATVSDWLGTAEMAARLASRHLEDMRDGSAGPEDLLEARKLIVQAWDEVNAVIARIAQPDAY